MREEQYQNKSLYLLDMKPVLVYFISGDFLGEHVEAMEDKLKEMYPDRECDVFYVDSEEEKFRLLDTYNLEELEGYLGNKLWEAIEDCDSRD